MPSTFTTNTGIEKIADGEQTGLWGQTTNLNFDIVDRALNGAGVISLSGTTHTLTTSNGVLSDGQFGVLVFGGSPSGTNTVTIAPNTAQKIYWVRNTTAQSVALTQGSGGNVTVPAGTVKVVYANGAGAGAAVVDLTNVLSMGSPAITGGTINGAVIGGVTPAAGAFTTLTATTSLTTPLLTNAGTLALSATGANVVTASTNGAERLRITSAGNVGVGTSSPATTLDVVGVIRSTSAGGTSQITTTSIGDTVIANDGVNWLTVKKGAPVDTMRITSAGNVGIGTTSPAESLHVNGTVRATGLNLNGTAVTATAAQINEGLAPPGSVIFHAANTAPTGYLKANGAAVSRSVYSDLDAAIYCGDALNATAAFGYRCTDPLNPSTSRSTTGTHIVLPDGRSEFIRGWDDGRGIDVGREFGSAQVATSLFDDRGGGLLAMFGVDGAAGDTVASGATNSISSRSGTFFDSAVGTFTAYRYAFKPRNIALLACIKY
jgi:hypothetical protein